MKIITNKKIVILFISTVFLLVFSKIAFAVWDGFPYNPGETNNPECLPSQTDCDVLPAVTTEVDPIFIASEAFTITGTDTTNWDTAYGWGNPSGVYLPLGGGTLTGDLALGIHNITSTGSLGATGAGKLLKGWFTDVEITNLPTINGGTLATALGNYGGFLTSVGTGVANELTYWSGTNTLGSLATATYPSLTELSYVKNVTSSIQSQLNGKLGTETALLLDQTSPQTIINGTPIFGAGLNVGTTSSGARLNVYATYGTELFTGFVYAGNWLAIAGWDLTNDGGTQLVRNANGIFTMTHLNPGFTPVVGTTYKVVFTVNELSVAGGASWTFGGVSGTSFTTTGTYTEYIKASVTSSFAFTPLASGTRFKINAISIKALADPTGGAYAYGNIFLGGSVRSLNGNSAFSVDPNGAVRMPVMIGGTNVGGALTGVTNLTMSGALANVTTITNFGAITETITGSNVSSPYGLVQNNAAVATGITSNFNSNQYSPSIFQRGYAWNATGTPASNLYATRTYIEPYVKVSGSGFIDGRQKWEISQNNSITEANFYEVMSLGKTGGIDELTVLGQTLASESLTNPNLTSGTSWTQTGGVALTGDSAVYTHGTGVGSLSQDNATMAIALKPNRWYRFTYTTSSLLNIPKAYLDETYTSAERVYLPGVFSTTQGVQQITFKTNGAPSGFKIQITSSVGNITFDTFSLKEINSGNVVASGLFTGGGTSGLKIDNVGNVGIGTTNPTVGLELGSATAGQSQIINATEEPEMAPALTGNSGDVGGWTLSDTTGYVQPFAGSIAKTGDGLGTITPTDATTIVIGNTYKVVITVASISGSTAYFALGSVISPLATAGTFEQYITAESTTKFTITLLATTLRINITSISIKKITDNTGDLTVNGDIIFNNAIKNSDGLKMLQFLPNGGSKFNSVSISGLTLLTEINTASGGTYGLRTNSVIKGNNFYLYNTTGGFYTSGGTPMFYATAGNLFGMGAINTVSKLDVIQPPAGIGTVSNSASGTTITGVGTVFTDTFKIGDTITATGGTSETRTISAIASNTSMTTDAWTNAHTTSAYTLVGGTRFSVKGNGNVGIGTVTPSGILSVTPTQYSTGTASQATTTVTGVGTTFTSAMVGSQLVFANGVSAGTITAFGSTTSLTVSTSQTVAEQAYKIAYTGLQVGSTGNVGIGTTGPGYLLHVGSVSVTDATVLLRLQDADSTCDFTANTGAPSCGSDITLKKNINNQSDNLTKILSLRPVTYNWLTDEDGVEVKHGFIAQEVESVMPELVTDGVWIDGTTKKFLQTAGMTPYIIGAIKEMNLKLMDINNFDKENDWRDSLIAWFANAENRITRIFTGEICLTEAGEEPVCLNRTELQSLKALLNQPVVNQIPVIEEPVIEEPVMEPVSEPVEEPVTKLEVQKPVEETKTITDEQVTNQEGTPL